MKTIKLTAAEWQTLMSPTRIQEWGDQQRVARGVQAQILALTGERVVIDAFDIAAINKSIEVNHVGAFIGDAASFRGGWPTTEWGISVARLQRAVGPRLVEETAATS